MRIDSFSFVLVTIAVAGVYVVGPAAAQEQPSAPVAIRPADSDAPLPAGFPDATAPGSIEVKSYPAYRSAVASGEGMTARSSDFLFWPLFRHIEARGVAMTAPVISSYETDAMIESPGTKGLVSMEFLYSSPDLGEAGQGEGTVQVVDHPAGQFLCLGSQGIMNDQLMADGLKRLEGWLAEHSSQWKSEGPPRRLGYHGPMTPAAQRRWELQIPIAAVAKPDAQP